MTDIKVVLLDIEGTVCSISFVKDVLYPFALKALPATLESEWDDPVFIPYRDAFPPEHRGTAGALAAHVADLTARDVKAGYLKALQGYLWQRGYESGEIRTPLFADVPARLRAWREQRDISSSSSVDIVIYSSGSVAAQRLLFRHTDTARARPDLGLGPDLTPLISDYFDTTNAGPKTEVASYARIMASRPDRAPPSAWLFLSDNVREVDAAKQAGMQSFVVKRPGNAPLAAEDRARHRVIDSFEEL